MAADGGTPYPYPRLRRVRAAVGIIKAASAVLAIASLVFFLACGLFAAVIPGVLVRDQFAGTVWYVAQWGASCIALAVAACLGFGSGEGEGPMSRFCVSALVAAAVLVASGLIWHDAALNGLRLPMSVVSEAAAAVLVIAALTGAFVLLTWRRSMRVVDADAVEADDSEPGACDGSDGADALDGKTGRIGPAEMLAAAARAEAAAERDGAGSEPDAGKVAADEADEVAGGASAEVVAVTDEAADGALGEMAGEVAEGPSAEVADGADLVDEPGDDPADNPAGIPADQADVDPAADPADQTLTIAREDLDAAGARAPEEGGRR